MSLLKVKPFSLDPSATFSFANANVIGNIVSGNATLGNLASANYFSGNASLLFGITAGNITGQVANALVAGTVYTAAQPNITSVGTLTSVTVSGATDLGAVANVKITGGSTGYVLKTDGQGNLSWSSVTSGTGNANVAGSNTQIQFNDGTNLSASGNLTFDVSTKTLAVDFISANGSALFGIVGSNVVGDVSGANHANVADAANSVAGANVSGAVAFATTANAVAGANVSGTVANATYATTAGSADSVAGANVTGTVANATYATTAGSADSVAGANVSGAVAFATTANSVAGANVSGTVANATYATTAGSADSVAGANVSGQVANALIAGTVYTNAQPNITSVGTLTSLTVTGSLSTGDATIAGNLTVTGTTTTVNSTVTQIVDPIFELGGGANGAALASDDGEDRGTLLHRYESGAVIDSFIGWDNSNLEFALGSNVSVANNVVTFNEYGNLRINNINANNANFGGVVFANGNIETSGNFKGNLVGDVNGNISGNIKVSGANGDIQFASNVTGGKGDLSSSGNLTFDVATSTFTVGANSAGGTVSADLLEGTLTTAAQPNVTSVGTLTTLAVSGTTDLGAVGNITISGGSANYFLKTDGSGTLSWSALPSTTLSVDTYTGDGSWTMKTLSSTPLNINYTIVAIGGIFQPREAYDVTGSTITFDDPPPEGYIVEVTIINGGTAGSAGYVYQGINASSTAIAGVRYLIDSSSAAVTLTLPASASLGDEIGIIDATGSAGTNNITVGRNGGKIEGSASDLTVSTNRSAFTLVYYNATQGWVKTQK